MDRPAYTKKDLIVVLGCVVFVFANLGAVGSTGRRRAKEAVCLSNLLRWAVIWKAYTEDTNGYFPKRGGGWDWPSLGAWCQAAWPYYRNPKLPLCPAATKPWVKGGTYPFAAWSYEEWDYETMYAGSYCMNFWLADSPDYRFWRTPYVSNAASVPLLLDGNWKDAEPCESDEPFPTREQMVFEGWTPNAHEMRRVCIDRHGAYVNACFLDFSAGRIGLKHLWRMPWHREWDMDYPLPVWPEWMQNFEDPE